MIHDFDEKALQGVNNLNPNSATRILKSNTYRDLSTVWVTPTRNHQLDDQVVFSSWMPLVMPMNQKVMKVCIANAEVGDAYNAAVDMILRDPVPWKYMLTVEVDNLPPKDGLMKLYESMGDYDIVGGLYWMKSEEGTPHIYGHPSEPTKFAPQVPLENTVQPCNMPGMGFCLFNVDVFRKVPGPWFKTSDASDAANPLSPEFTQDGYFFKRAAEAGIKCAVDTRIKVGHIDFQTRKIY